MLIEKNKIRNSDISMKISYLHSVLEFLKHGEVKAHRAILADNNWFLMNVDKEKHILLIEDGANKEVSKFCNSINHIAFKSMEELYEFKRSRLFGEKNKEEREKCIQKKRCYYD